MLSCIKGRRRFDLAEFAGGERSGPRVSPILVRADDGYVYSLGYGGNGGPG